MSQAQRLPLESMSMHSSSQPPSLSPSLPAPAGSGSSTSCAVVVVAADAAAAAAEELATRRRLLGLQREEAYELAELVVLALQPAALREQRLLLGHQARHLGQQHVDHGVGRPGAPQRLHLLRLRRHARRGQVEIGRAHV